jgi:hypothetical protein
MALTGETRQQVIHFEMEADLTDQARLARAPLPAVLSAIDQTSENLQYIVTTAYYQRKPINTRSLMGYIRALLLSGDPSSDVHDIYPTFGAKTRNSV